VHAQAAQRHLLSLAPCLQTIAEYWPGTGPRANKVRLPAGKYVQPGFAAWCTLTDAQGTHLSTDGPGAACVLLAHQTPAELVPEVPIVNETLGKPEGLEGKCSRQKTQVQAGACVVVGQVDTRWQQQYTRSTLWFQFTPRQLAALYNERHSLSDLLPVEQNGMAFSPSVQERTPSTAITRDGMAWVDFSARSLQPDGKHDGGDALELAARRNGEPKTAKSATLREAARMLVREARDALERAARAGEQVPTWVAEILTEAGWQRYRSLRTEAARAVAGTTSRGVAGCTSAAIPMQAAQEQIPPEAAQPAPAMQVVSSESSQEQDSPLALATEIGAHIGEPCSRCGCTLFYRSGSYRMCHQCFPRPVKFGRLTDEQWLRLRELFPRKPAPSDLSWKRR
jgi:hypothetical protein